MTQLQQSPEVVLLRMETLRSVAAAPEPKGKVLGGLVSTVVDGKVIDSL